MLCTPIKSLFAFAEFTLRFRFFAPSLLFLPVPPSTHQLIEGCSIIGLQNLYFPDAKVNI